MKTGSHRSIAVSLFSILMVVVPIISAQQRQSGPQLEDRQRKPERTEREFIEIMIGDQQSFKLFVGEDRNERVQGIVPIKGAQQESYIRVKPRLSDDVIIVDSFLVIGHMGSPQWCEEIDKLTNIHISTDLLRRGEVKRFGESDSRMSRISIGYGVQETFRTQDEVPPEGEQDPSGRPPAAPKPGCCLCQSLECCPDPGQCLTCGDCGQCCRRR